MYFSFTWWLWWAPFFKCLYYLVCISLGRSLVESKFGRPFLFGSSILVLTWMGFCYLSCQMSFFLSTAWDERSKVFSCTLNVEPFTMQTFTWHLKSVHFTTAVLARRNITLNLFLRFLSAILCLTTYLLLFQNCNDKSFLFLLFKFEI